MKVNDDNLYERQIKREKDSDEDGITRYYAREAMKAAHDTAPGKALINGNLDKVAACIQEKRDRFAVAKPQHVPDWYAPTLEVDTLALAWLALSQAMYAAMKSKNAVTAGSLLAGAIQRHIFFQRFNEQYRQQAEWAAERAEKMPEEFRRTRHLTEAALKAGVERPDWDDATCWKVGCALINMVVESTNLVTDPIIKGNSLDKRPRHYVLTDEAHEHIEDVNALCSTLRPVRRWMVCEPRDWTSIDDGGYLIPDGSVTMVRRATPRQRSVLESPPESFTNALNVMQRTPFKINKALLYTIRLLEEANDPIIPRPADIEIPQFTKRQKSLMADKASPPEELAEIKRIIAERRIAKDARSKVTGRANAHNLAVQEAHSLQDEEAIWTPLSTCFRGRAYPLVGGFHYQNSDMQRALLVFAKGKVVGPDGAYWLHVAWSNAFGHDKVSLDDRVQFTQDHIEAIFDAARNPLDRDAIWRLADEPFQCLALCFELLNLYEVGEDSYVSHMPVGVDATASGLQHYAALKLDPEGAEAVCLTPMDVPNDLYTQVAEKVESKLSNELSNTEVAAEWSGWVTRKTVKQCVMTLSYGASAFGRKNQIKDAIDPEHIPDTPDNAQRRTNAAKILEPVVYEAIGEEVASGLQAMTWLQQVVELVLKAGQSVDFLTALDFPVDQQYWTKNRGKAVKIWTEGKRRVAQPPSYDRTKPNIRKHVGAIAANYIHGAGDATHMYMTVNLLETVGVTDFRTVHDSIAVHPCDVSELVHGLKLTFLDLYGDGQDWLEDFENQMLARVDEETAAKIRELQPLRQQLDHDLSSVIDADFFFG